MLFRVKLTVAQNVYLIEVDLLLWYKEMLFVALSSYY